MQFQLSGLTGNSTVTLSVPNASTTIVGTDVAQTLTNKTITDSTNNIMAKSLKSATTTIDVSASTAPSAGQALIATSGTSATWQSVPPITFSSSVFTFFDFTTVYASYNTPDPLAGGLCTKYAFDGKYIYFTSFTDGAFFR